MSKPFEVERHDYVTNRMKTLISEMEISVERMRVMLAEANERVHELRQELAQERSRSSMLESRLNQMLDAIAANEIRR